MQINCHTHVFNLRSVLTKRAFNLFCGRFEADPNLPKPVKRALRVLLQRLLEGLLDTDLAAKAVEEPTESSARLLMEALAQVGQEDKTTGAALQRVTATKGLVRWRERLRAFATDCADWIEEKCKVDEVLAYLDVAFAGSIDQVTDHLFSPGDGMPGESIAVTLMMDIYDEQEYQQNRDPFPGQLDDTAAQILRYPGRFLPFVAINPQRPNLGTWLDIALRHKGFVGVKLYPSLGDCLDVGPMKEVFQYCSDHRVPITMHCSTGGFTTGDYWHLCNPSYWRRFLQDYPNLTVNFAHFAHFWGVTAKGNHHGYTCEFENPAATGTAIVPYAIQIVELMRAFPGRVYADVACHTELWEGAEERAQYRARIRWLCQQPVGSLTVGDYLLWGSDFWMMRGTCSEADYWKRFRKDANLPASLFAKMSDINARRFLRFDEPDSTVANYVKYVGGNRQPSQEVLGPPAWLSARLAVSV